MIPPCYLMAAMEFTELLLVGAKACTSANSVILRRMIGSRWYSSTPRIGMRIHALLSMGEATWATAVTRQSS